jgi:hypothetical protein
MYYNDRNLISKTKFRDEFYLPLSRALTDISIYSNVVAHGVSRITYIRYAINQKIGNQNKLKVFGSK